MADPRLALLAKAVEAAHEQVGKGVSAEAKSPYVILIVSGVLVSGRVASSGAYLRGMRESVPKRSGEPAGPFVEQLLKDPGFSLAPTANRAGNLERIHLEEVTIAWGSRVVDLGNMVIEMDAVQGWTLGKFKAPK